MQIVWIGSLFFALLIALFAVQNTAPVTVSFLAWRIESVAASMLVLASAALGALTTYLFGLSREIRGSLERRGSRSTIRDQDTVIEELRTRVRELEQDNERLRAGVGSQGPGVGGQESGAPADPNPASAPAPVMGFPPTDSPPADSPPVSEPTDVRAGDPNPRLPTPDSRP